MINVYKKITSPTAFLQQRIHPHLSTTYAAKRCSLHCLQSSRRNSAMPLVRRRSLHTRNSNGHLYLISFPLVNRRRSSSTFSSGNQSDSPFQKSFRMAEESSMKDTSRSIEFNCDSSDSTVVIKIKTLDLQTYSFRVNNNMPLSALMEEIVTKIGVPFEQQRLLYKGKFLNDHQLLSEFNLEDGDTMHLIERHPVTSQPASPTVAADASTSSNQDSHLINLYVEDGDVLQLVDSRLVQFQHLSPIVAADASRTSSSSQGAGAESSQNTNRIQSDNPTNTEPISLNQLISVASAPVPTFPSGDEWAIVPDALTSICEFINLLEGMFRSSRNSGNNGQQQLFWTHTRTDFTDPDVVPTPEFLSFVLDRTEDLLRGNVTTAFFHLSTCLQRIDSSSSPVLRGQIHSEAMQFGGVMQHLGAMFLELGRVTMCLRMGETPEESMVLAGPAVYITPTGPNPRMIQPSSPHQPFTSSGTCNAVYVGVEHEQSVPTSQILGSTTSTGHQIHEPTLQSPPLSGSDSAPALGAHANVVHSSAAQGFERRCDMPSSSFQNDSNIDRDSVNELSTQLPSGGQGGSEQTGFFAQMTNTMQSPDFCSMVANVAAQSRVSTSALRSVLDRFINSPFVQRSFNHIQQLEQRRDPESRLELADITRHMLLMVSETFLSLLTSVVHAEDIQPEPRPEPNDVMTCAIESLNDSNYQVDNGQAIERIEQNGDPRSIFRALLANSVHLYGEQDVHQDMVELGDDEELANEFMQVLRRDIRRRLAKESSSSTDKL